jgi:hypothetical protein
MQFNAIKYAGKMLFSHSKDVALGQFEPFPVDRQTEQVEVEQASSLLVYAEPAGSLRYFSGRDLT